jgi:hypothetical protein
MRAKGVHRKEDFLQRSALDTIVRGANDTAAQKIGTFYFARRAGVITMAPFLPTPAKEQHRCASVPFS